MKESKMGIGVKIFAGFIALIVIGAVIGGAGYLTLNKVNSAGGVNVVADDLQTKVFEARTLEKDYIIKKDDESFNKLTRALDELGKLTVALRSVGSDNKSADEIAAAQQVYKKATADLKALDVEDAAAMADLQDAASRIITIADDESSKAFSAVRDEMVKGNAKAMKDNALKRIRDIVAIGYDVMKFYNDQSQPREAALEAVRNLHFEGDNYFFVVQEDLILVAHGSNRKLEGKDFGSKEYFDKKTNKSFMKEVVDGAMKSGESYTEYYWPKPGQGETIFPKVTFARYFKPWGLIICAGVYIDDIEKAISDSEVVLKDGLKKVEQAALIGKYCDQARLNATYYMALGKNSEKVGESLTGLKNLPIATAGLKKEADSYLTHFNHRVSNNEKRRIGIAQIDDAAARIVKISSEIGQGAQDTFSRSTASGKTVIIGFIVVGLISGVVFAILLARAIITPVRRAVAGIEEASDQVASASRQVSAASQQLAEGSSEQAASLEETSSALEEMASMTKMNAENATHADQLVKGSAGDIQDASAAMGELIHSMQEISVASENTQKIIKTIDEIAFQTNLLALNAAVEAARAGEAGAGFAVVADEVRNLAMRAAEAAKNTANLIEGTVKKIKAGSDTVAKAHGAFAKVTASSQKTGELIGEIAVASQEQSHGIEEVNRAVSEMDKVTQQNAANAEESASASTELNAQAEQMKGFVEELSSLAGLKSGQSDGKRRVGLPPPTGSNVPAAKFSNAGAARQKALTRQPPDGKKPRGEVRPEEIIPFDEEDLKHF